MAGRKELWEPELVPRIYRAKEERGGSEACSLMCQRRAENPSARLTVC